MPKKLNSGSILSWHILAIICMQPVLAQSWSAWKQLAEEQMSKGQLAQAEASWQSAYRSIQQSGSKDSRLYISALELAKVQIAEKRPDDTRKFLKQICADFANTAQLSTEEIACLQSYQQICNEAQDKAEFDRVGKLLEQAQKKQTATIQESNTSSLLFGEEAKEDVNKKIVHARQLISQKDYAAAELDLNSALASATNNHASGILTAVVTEQSKLYSITKDYKKAELAYRQLRDLAREQFGAESRNYLEALGPHARLLHMLGQNDQAAIEETRCAIISSKLKTVAINSGEMSAGAMSWDLTASRGPATGPQGAQVYSAPAMPASSNAVASAPKFAGRLKVYEFYAVW